MTLDARQIEAIVRDVLRSMRHSAEPTLAETASSDRQPPSLGAEPNPIDQPPTKRSLTLLDRVVSLAQLDGKLNGLTELHVSQRAVVTPSVFDVLRERSIRLVRDQATIAGHGRLKVVRVIDLNDQGMVKRELDSLPIVWTDIDWPTACRRLTTQDANFPGQMLVYTHRWAKLTCDANRASSVRAATVYDLASAQQACEQLSPNVLVVDASRVDPRELCRILQGLASWSSFRDPSTLNRTSHGPAGESGASDK